MTAQTADITQARPLRAAAYMLGTLLSFSLMSVAGREISAELNTFETLAYRSVIGFVIICLVIRFLSPKGFGQVRSGRYGLHGIRTLVHFGAQNCWFFAIAVIPLAQVTALELTSPIWVALLAPLLLSEKLTKIRLLAALIGFIGVLLIARPGISPLGIGHAAALAAAIGFALNTIAVKRLSSTETTLCILFWMTLSQAILGFGFAAPTGITMFSFEMTPWVIVLGITGLSAHFCLTKALTCAPASIVAPMEFMRLPLIAVVGMLLYLEPLEFAVFAGSALVLLGNLLNIRAERRMGPRTVGQRSASNSS